MHMKLLLSVFASLSVFCCATTNGQETSTRVGVAATEKGFTGCRKQLDFFVKFVYEDKQDYAYLNTWNKSSANERLFNSITAKKYSDGYGVAIFNVGKSASGGCDGVVTQALHSPSKTCAELRETTFKAWKFYSDLGGIAVYDLEGEPGSNVLLITMVGGCLIVKQVMLYGAKAEN